MSHKNNIIDNEENERPKPQKKKSYRDVLTSSNQ